MIKQKRKAQQDIIVTVLLVLIALAAVAAVAYFVINNVKNTTNTASNTVNSSVNSITNCNDVNLKIVSASVVTRGGYGYLDVIVTSQSGSTTATDVRIFVDEINCTIQGIPLEPGQTKTYSISVGTSCVRYPRAIKSAEVAAVIGNNVCGRSPSVNIS